MTNDMDTSKFIINNAFLEKKIICICLNKIDWDKRIFAFIESINEDLVALTKLNQYGASLGMISVAIKAIQSIELGGIYNDNLEMLFKLGFVANKMGSKYIVISDISYPQAILGRLCDTQKLCTFYFEENYSIGIITSVSADGELIIRNISYHGEMDGVSLLALKSLTKIRYNSPFENRIAFILNNRPV